MHKLSFIAAVCLLIGAVTAHAQVPFEALEDPEQQARYMALIQEVRCLTCLNRSVAESDTPLAHDLRREIRELIEGGASDSEVADFLTERYGDFVLYRPPLRPRTYLLWAAPILFLGIGAVVFGIVLARRLRQPIDDDDDDDELNDELST
jgi:cytochrome c-type biogenesis protein CcmH